MYFVYILRSRKTGRYYIGQTNNLDRRFSFHNAGRERYTRRGIPWEVVFAKELASRSARRNCGDYIKKQKSIAFIEKVISGQYELPDSH